MDQPFRYAKIGQDGKMRFITVDNHSFVYSGYVKDFQSSQISYYYDSAPDLQAQWFIDNCGGFE